MLIILCLILFLPLLNALLLLSAQRFWQKRAGVLASVFIGLSLLLSLSLFVLQWQKPIFLHQIPWFSLNRRLFFTVDIVLDNLGSAMLVLVNFIAFLVHLFSLEYMRHEANYARYFGYLGVFTFAMLGIIISDNLLITYFFWELVGFSSYLLIGFWYKKASAVRAAKKAFLINRLGDTGFLIGIILIWVHFGTFQLSVIEVALSSNSLTSEISAIYFSLMGFALFCGAIGKSAQFPLQVWLPDAMEGPTPVSALIHAATMVAAGVFLTARIFFMLDQNVLILIAFLGTITAVLGALSALIQKDIKKVLAYSTISQLGYMMIGMGVGAYSASLFHLFTHAFFKAGLFLGAGAIIHTLHQVAHHHRRDFDAQNMYLMGGLAKRMPFTALCFTLSALSLIGLPLFSGFLSKDAILSGAWAWAMVMSKEKGGFLFYIVPMVGFFTVFLTALYVGRMLLLIFVGKFNLDRLFRQDKDCFPLLQDPPWVMKFPLAILALLSLFLIFNLNPFTAENAWLYAGLTTPENFFLGVAKQATLNSVHADLHLWSALLSVAVAMLGLGFAYWLDARERVMNRTFHKYARTLSKWTNGGRFQEIFFRQRLVQPGLASTQNIPQLEQAIINSPLNFSVRLGLSFSQVLARWDSMLIDGMVNLLARMQVVVAHVLAWIDKYLIDGSITVFTWSLAFVGNQTRSLQGGKLQAYMIWLILIFCVLIIFFLGFS